MPPRDEEMQTLRRVGVDLPARDCPRDVSRSARLAPGDDGLVTRRDTRAMSPAMDRLTAAELAGETGARCVGRDIRVFRIVDSTNTLALRLARAGVPEGTVVVADAQRAGRGRRGRSWESPPGRNLYLSVIFRPPGGARAVLALTALAGLAVHRTLAEVAGVVPEVVWPNDLYLDSRKVAGILAEASDRSEALVVGVGINVNAEAGDFSPGLRPAVTSLRQVTGHPFRRRDVARALLWRLDDVYRSYHAGRGEALLRVWEALTHIAGRPVTVRCGTGTLPATALGLTADGALLVRDAHDGLRALRDPDAVILA